MQDALGPSCLASYRLSVEHSYIVELHEILGLSYDEIGGKDPHWLWAKYLEAKGEGGF